MVNPYKPKSLVRLMENEPSFQGFLGTVTPPIEPVDRPPVMVQVPEGSVAQVLEWVGEDLLRARVALAQERKGARRKTLVAALEKVLDE